MTDHQIWLRMPPGPNEYLSAQFTSTTARLIETRTRKWWQFWKPRCWQHVLAEVPHTPRVNDRVELGNIGKQLFIRVNGSPILSYPKPQHHQRQGFGMVVDQ